MRNFLIVTAVLIGAGYYLTTTYSLRDVLAYNRKHADPSYSPAVDYYIGMGYYTRGDYGPASAAFTQLLTDYPTCQYAEPGLVKLGESDEALSQWEGAKAAYEKYLEQFPNGPRKVLVQNKFDEIKFKGK